MRRVLTLLAGVVFLLSSVASVSAGESEQDIVNRYLKTKTKEQQKKVAWASASYSYNRVNRANNYNSFADYSSTHFSDGDVSWINSVNSFGIDFGLSINEKFAFSLGGEYWLKAGQNESGSFDYNPPDKPASTVTNLVSEVAVYGGSVGLNYYVTNGPTSSDKLTKLALRVNGTVGYYQAKWDVWPEYQNLNLATSSYANVNTTYNGSAPGFSLGLGADYPLGFGDFAFGIDMSYLYLNFSNVAWYNSADQEIVATYANTEDARVDLNFSGVRGKVEIKKFFAW